MKYFIDPDMFDRATKFADSVISTNKNRYANRNQSNLNKIKKDIIIGKLGEELAYLHLFDQFPHITKPDYTIYSASGKSWEPDLKTDILNIAVKSQDVMSGIYYGVSWIFQFNNNKNYDCDKEIFKNKSKNQYVVLTSIDLRKEVGEIKAIVNVNWMHEKNLFKEPEVKILKGNKLAVYFEDMEKYKDELWQL